MHSRPEVVLIACRRAADGQPLAPSRLLLACDDDALVRRIRRFYDERARDTAPLLLVPGEAERFLIPSNWSNFEKARSKFPRFFHSMANQCGANTFATIGRRYDDWFYLGFFSIYNQAGTTYYLTFNFGHPDSF